MTKTKSDELASGRSRSIAISVVAVLLASFITFSPAIESEPAFATSVGVCNGTPGGGVSVTPSHGKVMYIDTGQGQNINASYVGYKVTASGNQSDLWVKLDGFENDIVQLANPLDQYMQLGAVNASSKVAYFLLRADRPTTAAQTHNVRVFSGNPEISGNTEIYSCTFSFQRVRETIKASANKVESVTSTSVSAIGDELVVTHKGITGVIGAGSAPDNNMIWISPASNASWPTRALKLTSVQVIFYSNKSFNGSTLTKTDELILSPARNTISLGQGADPKSYQATYRFRVIGQGKATIAPVAQISSGTQIKHTDMSGFYNTNGTAKFPVDTTNTVINAKTTKVGAGITTSGTSVVLRYSVSVQNTGSTAITIDDIVDTASSAMSYRAGSAKTGTPFPGTTTVRDAFVSSFRNSDGTVDSSKRNFTFVGPFTIAGNSTLQLNYEMLTACTNSTSAYDNSAISRIGDTQIGTSASSIQKVATTLVASESGGTCTVNVGASGQSESVVRQATEVTALPATEITTTGARLNGRVDSNGVADQTISCEYSTEASMAGAQTVAASVPVGGKTTSSTSAIEVSCLPTGLQPGTTYYYRIKVEGPDGTVLSTILSFTTTTQTFATPTVATSSPSLFSLISGSGNNPDTVNATLNGLINPRGNVTRARFQYFENATSTCPVNLPGSGVTTLSTLDFNDAEPPVANLPLVLSGGFESAVEFALTGLTVNKWHCYRILGDYPFDTATNTAANTLNGSFVAFFTSGSNPPAASTEPATLIGNNGATLNGTVTKGTVDAGITFCLSETAPTTSSLTNCRSISAPSPSTTSSAVVNPLLAVTGLTQSTTYYYQTVAAESSGSNRVTSLGNIESFTTTGPPIATTNAATNVLSTTATINGNVSANGAETTVYFCFTPDASSTATSGYLDACLTSGSPDVSKLRVPSVSSTIAAASSASRYANLTGLTATTTYKFQVLGNSSNGWAKGEILSFTTAVQAVLPTVATNAASSVGGTIATLNGSITAGNATTTSGFCWGTDSGLSGCTQIPASPSSVTGNSSTSISADLTGLSKGTVYYFRASGQNSVGTSTGVIRTFTTTADPATVQTDVPTPVGVTTSTLRGSVTAGTYAVNSITFCLSTTGNTSNNTIGTCDAGTQGTVSGNTLNALASGTPSVTVTGLSADTEYFVRVIATSATSGATVNGQVRSFRTAVVLGTATTSAASSVASTTATLNSSVVSGTYGGDVKFCYSTSATASGGVLSACSNVSSLTSASSGGTLTGSASGTPSLALTGLTFGTTYYFQVVFEPSSGSRVYGSILEFTTTVVAPTAATDAASSITAAGATLNGTVVGGSRGSTVTFCLSTTGDVGANTIGSCGTGTQGSVSPSSSLNANSSSTSRSVGVTGLSGATTYYFRVIVTPSSGSAVNGPVLSFTTATLAGTATTSAASSVTQNSATLNSTVGAGTLGVTVKFCFATSGADTAGVMNACSSDSDLITASTGASIAGSGSANSTLSRTGLSPNTTYYFQVVNIPTSGSKVYGAIRDFTTVALGAGATTSPATDILTTSATLNGSVSSGTFAVTVEICLSTTGNTSSDTIGTCLSGLLGTPSPSTLSPNTTSTPVSVPATGLSPATDYYYLVSVDPTTGSKITGQVLRFTTAAANNSNNGGGGGGGGGPTPTASPTPTPSAQATPAPRPNNRPTARPTPPPAAPRPTPVPFVPAAPTPAPISPNASGPKPVTTPDATAEAPLQIRPSLPGQAARAAVEASAGVEATSGPTESTVDLGSGVENAPATSAAPNGDPESTTQRARRTVPQLAAERLNGFAEAAGLRIEVLGARTGARFVLSTVTGIDDVALVAALNASRDREITNFSELTEFSVATRPLISKPWTQDVREGINEFFAASGLAAPKALVDLELGNVETWVRVTGKVETYYPGSTVFLITTSEPVVIGTAQVDKDGRATVTGVIPVEALGAGAHSVRVVGTRLLDGVSVDADGKIQLTNEVMQEIQLFDGGTQATVAVGGLNPGGGYHTALRVVPLDLTIYWWTLWFIPLAFLVVAGARYFRKLRNRTPRLIGAGVILLAAIPGLIAGWLQSTTWLLVAALLLGVAGSVASWIVKEKKQQAKRKS